MTRWLVGFIVAAFMAIAGVAGPGTEPGGEAVPHRARAAAPTGNQVSAPITAPKAGTEPVPELPRTGAAFLVMLALTGLFIGSGVFLLLIGRIGEPPTPADADVWDPRG